MADDERERGREYIFDKIKAKDCKLKRCPYKQVTDHELGVYL